MSQQAKQQRAEADAIVRKAGVDPKELDRLYQQSVAEGKAGNDVIQRYEKAHAGDPDLDGKLAALRQAEPLYRRAGDAAADADELDKEADNLGGGASG